MGRSVLVAGAVFLLFSCQMGDSEYTSEEQWKQLNGAYDSLNASYNVLIEEYETTSGTLPLDLNALYSKMKRTYQQMDASQEHMMRSGMSKNMQDDRMIGSKMRAHLQGHMTGEWYHLMMEMHEQIAIMHHKLGQSSMAKMNRQLSDEYGEMLRMIPRPDEPSEAPFDTKGNPSLLDRENLYPQNCASCHGSRGQDHASP